MSAYNNVIVFCLVGDKNVSVCLMSEATRQTISLKQEFCIKKLKLCTQEEYKNLLLLVGES